MNNKIKNTFRLGIIAAAGAAAMVSCSDTWDDHYKGGAVIEFNGTTLQAIEENAPDFAKVIKAYGFDRELASDNVYTIWAPADGSFTLSDYVVQGNMGELLRVADSTDVVDRFIKNHIARYAVSQNGTEQDIMLLNTKMATMTGEGSAEGSIEACDITRANLSCANGILHLIDGEMDYKNNIYEQIRAWDDAGEDEASLYAYLEEYNADSLDENKSISRGVDAYGNKIWIDSVTIRNNTALRSVDAPVYEEDSSFIAIIPTAKAYQKRLEIAKSLLVFNPSEDAVVPGICDSLQNYYGNMFAMSDLFYNKNLNAKAYDEGTENYDSLRSTLFKSWNWPYNLYYSKEPRLGLHPDKQVNDILTKAKAGTMAECSNGEAYLVDEYPMSVTEQFFKKLQVMASDRSLDQTQTTNSQGQTTNAYTRLIGTPYSRSGVIYDYETETSIDEETGEEVTTVTGYTMRNYHFYGVPPQNDAQQPYIAFKVPNTLSGTYELYLVTCPIWAKNGFEDGAKPEDDPRGYRFYTNIYERNEKGEYGSAKRLSIEDFRGIHPEYEGLSEKNYYITNYENPIDTLYLGDYTFKNAYYNRSEEGVLIQFQVQVGSKLVDQYSREMLFSSIILKPKFEEAKEEEESVEE